MINIEGINKRKLFHALIVRACVVPNSDPNFKGEYIDHFKGVYLTYNNDGNSLDSRSYDKKYGKNAFVDVLTKLKGC